jgi:beta-glucanase (GH16 family)
MSAALRSRVSIKYGRVEVKARVPLGDWLWPAIWMLPTWEQYGGWPASGEIDIMESRGNKNYQQGMGVESFASTLHWGPYWAQDPFSLTHAEYSLPQGTFHDSFHVFGLYWDETGLYTYLDNDTNRILNVNFTDASFWEKGKWANTFDNPWRGRGNAAPFDQEFYLIINLAVGGVTGYWPDGVGNKPWNNGDAHAVNSFYDKIDTWYPSWQGEDAALQIDSVKMWQKV